MPPAATFIEPQLPVGQLTAEVPAIRGAVDGEALWREVQEAPLARPQTYEPIRSGLPRALAVLAILAAVVLAAYLWLPRSLLRTPATGAASPALPVLPAAGPQAQAKFMTDHALLEQRITALEARGAAIWGGGGFVTAKSRAAQAAGAQATGNVDLARQQLAEAGQLLNAVEEAAPGALAAELAAGEQAVAAGQSALATQAYDLAVRIAPQDERALAGQARARQLAAAAHPSEPAPAAAATHTDPAFGEDRYAKAAGEGFAALGAGRLNEARAAFERARSLRPDGAEAIDGLKRVDAAEHSRGFGSLQTRAEDLEADERWDEALATYNSALRQNPSLEFAQQGKARAQARLDLSESLQGFIDRPDRLTSAAARTEAETTLQSAQTISSPGPALRLQIARVSALLPELDKTVRLSLVSDGLTQVSIPEVGSFGGFTRRDVELKPGRYTVIGTREGYRDVRRDVTVTPGQQGQTINVTCYDPS
jgi:tetratricopeptide (TPR) repeat protein